MEEPLRKKQKKKQMAGPRELPVALLPYFFGPFAYDHGYEIFYRVCPDVDVILPILLPPPFLLE